ASGAGITAYQIAVTDVFDTQIAMVDSAGNFLQDSDKNYYYCGNAGDSSTCWGNSTSLRGSWVSRTDGRSLAGGIYDSMITFTLNENDLDKVLYYAMRGESGTVGDYVVVFHTGIGQP